MKFGKEFNKQQVPEWMEAYMDYNGVLQELREAFTDTQEADIENQLKRQSEINFFESLDKELNKVNTFYRAKVEEVVQEDTLLTKQMDALIALRIKVYQSSDSSSTESPQANSPGRIDPLENMDTDSDINETDPPSILDHVRMNNTCEDPKSIIRIVVTHSRYNNLKFTKAELEEAERRLKVAFIEFYRKLYQLKLYRDANIKAFSKISKKYEKARVAERREASSNIKPVNEFYIRSCDKVNDLLDQVRETFTKQFANSDERVGMTILRPKGKREQQWVTFCSGCFTGCTICVLIAIILLILSRKIMSTKEHVTYMENIFPLYSLYAYVILHVLMYVADIYFWRRCRINYRFIFGFKQGTELSHYDVLLIGMGLAVLTFGTFLAHVYMKVDHSNSVFTKYVDFLPLGLLVSILFMFFCPINILYKSSRFFLIRTLYRGICAPLYQVQLADFLLVDQLCSQIQAIRCLQFYICYYGLASYQKEHKCHSLDLYNAFYVLVSLIPYWLRFLQCVRRYFQENDRTHLLNASKFSLTIITVVVRTVFELKTGTTWKVLAISCSLAAICFNLYWDLVMDWGLLQRNSKNRFLRDKLSVSRRSVYLVAMVLDGILRLTWLQLVLKFNIPALKGTAISSLFSCLEIFRRGVWMFFRLENEHLNNVGKYRAFRSFPLPFSYYEEDGVV